jgi:hypothetical protein
LNVPTTNAAVPGISQDFDCNSATTPVVIQNLYFPLERFHITAWTANCHLIIKNVTVSNLIFFAPVQGAEAKIDIIE